MRITSVGYESIKELPSISFDGIETRDDVPIGLFPQLFEFYRWLQQSKIWVYYGNNISIPDKIEWDGMEEGWYDERVLAIFQKDNIFLHFKFISSKIGEYNLDITIWTGDEDENRYNVDSPLFCKFKFTEKDILDLPLIEKHIEKCQQFCDEMEQVYNDRQRACDDILMKYK